MTVDETLEKLKTIKGMPMVNLYCNIKRDYKDTALKYIQEFTGCDEEIALKVYDIRQKEILEIERQRKEHVAEEKQKYIPKCPTCGSPDIKKITGGKRWITTGIFGLGSSNLGKTMECNNCGYKW